MIDKRSREYLKTAKPAPISHADRQMKGRPAKREETRSTLKMANWRFIRNSIRAKSKIPWSRRLSILKNVLMES